MSFLNALASDGLSVGLRFYNEKINNRAAANARMAAADIPSVVQPGQPFPMREPLAGAPAQLTPPLQNGEPSRTVRVEGLETPPATANVRPRPAPKAAPTSEELAAGRAEAKAMLGADGSLGQLAASQSQAPENAAPAAGTPGGAPAAAPSPPPPPAGGGSPDGLSPEDQQEVERLKAREAQIKAEVASSVQKGVEGAESVRYTYVKGPDDNRYISGIQGGGGQPQPGGSTPGSPASDKQSADAANELSKEEQEQVADMRQRDQEVRIHEQAHVAAAAGMAGAPVYEYQTGPDGKRYAVGGHVDIRSSGSSDPDVALREAEAVKRAATAPADPSGPDRAAAAQASAQINQLKAEKARQAVSNDEDEAGKEGQSPKFGGDDSKQANGNGSRLAEVASGLLNGSGLSRQAAGAYAAMKLGYAALAPRPALARA
ncbi:MAG: hypothetical protein LBV79_07535 [Candidatus Adiutrix sp.]|jgi:hypothetical protein|nr:hypothetical protein [Candidatus Adiutrix sp.]